MIAIAFGSPCGAPFGDPSTRPLRDGGLLRQGFTFVALDSGNYIRLRTPDGTHVIRVELGEDDILYLEHELQRDTKCANYVKKTLATGSYEMLHYLFSHVGLLV